MSDKKPIGMGNLFAQAGTSQQVAQLKDRVGELEAEIEQLRNTPQDNQIELQQHIDELTAQLAARSGVHTVEIDRIKPDPSQPRTVFPSSVIQARAKSLREDGQQNPITLIPQSDDTFILFDGELRWRSAPLAGMSKLNAVLLVTPNFNEIETFDRQLTTSIQSEKLHPFDLANGLARLILYRCPDLKDRLEDLPSILNSAIQRFKRSDTIQEFDQIRYADCETQQQWLELANFKSDEEHTIFAVIFSKGLNPTSVNSNVFPLLGLPADLQDVIQSSGLEASKIQELRKLSAASLNVDQEKALHLRAMVTEQVVNEQLSLSKIRALVQDKIIHHNQEAVIHPQRRKIERLQKQINNIDPSEFDEGTLVQIQKMLKAKLKDINALLKGN